MSSQDFDLPDPKPRPRLSYHEYNKRRFSLYRNMFIFAALYASVHKIFLPLILSQSTILIKEYTQIDLWILPSLFLAFYLYQKKSWGALASFLSGVLIAYTIWDLNAIFRGQHKGWLAWSHAISSLPQGILALVLMSTQKPSRSLKLAWSGAALTLLSLLLIFIFSSHGQNISDQEHPTSDPQIPNAIATTHQCGTQSFRIETLLLEKISILEINDCGFFPSAFAFDNLSRIQLNRNYLASMNIHLIYFDVHGRKVRQNNRILKSEEKTVLLNELKFNNNEVAALLYSDALPKLGKVMILNTNFANRPYEFGVTDDRKFYGSFQP